MFNPQIAHRYAAALARPRRVGTRTHAAIADEISAQLSSYGWAVNREPFEFTTAPDRVLKLLIAWSMICLTAMLIWREHTPVAAAGAALVLLVSIGLFNPLNRRAQLAALDPHSWLGRLGARERGQNLVATWPGASTDDRAHVLLVAHYDSKSQWLPLTARIALFVVAATAGAIASALALLNGSLLVGQIAGFIALAAALPLLALDAGNRSPGAIDNASSVGLLLHLAEVLAQRVDGRAGPRVTLLLPDAEELFVMGATAYVRAHADQLRAEQTCVLNFDGIGVDGELYYVGRKADRVVAQLQAACASLNYPLKPFRFFGALFDHLPFAQQGVPAATLIAVSAASRSVHTPHDASDQLHVRGFEQAGRVALHVIEGWAKQ